MATQTQANEYSSLLTTVKGWPEALDKTTGVKGDQDLGQNKDLSTGLYNNLNEFKAYVFSGKANKVKEIYESFNKDGDLTSVGSFLKPLSQKAGFSDKIKIVPDKLLFNGKINYTTEDLDKLTKSGIFGMIRNGAEGLANISSLIGSVGSIFDKKEGKTTVQGDAAIENLTTEIKTHARSAGQVTEFPLYINKYKNIPYYTDFNIESLTNITFKFAFGQSRVFSSLDEVVKPIVGIINLFNMKKKSGADFFESTGVMPSKSEALTSMYANLFGSDSKSGSLTGALETGTDSNKKLETLFNNLATTFANMVTSAASNNDITALVFSIGNYIMGPYLPTSIEWNFDFNRVDENGYPCSGDITFNGLKMVDMDPDYITMAWGLAPDPTPTSSTGATGGSTA